MGTRAATYTNSWLTSTKSQSNNNDDIVSYYVSTYVYNVNTSGRGSFYVKNLIVSKKK